MNKKQLAGILAGILAFSYLTIKTIKKPEIQNKPAKIERIVQEYSQPTDEKEVEQTPRIFTKQIILPGTWTYDIDSLSLSDDPHGYTDWIKRLGFIYPNYGAKDDECDLFLQHKTKTKRSLVPLNKAKLANLGKIDFSSIALEDLIKADYSGEEIKADDDDNHLTPGTVIAVKTSKGKYAKIRIDGYYSSNANEDPLEKYHIRATIVGYDLPIKDGRFMIKDFF